MAADQRLVKAIMSGRGKGANLEDADLEGARLQGVDFSRANLDGANLRNAYLLGANLKGVHAMYADFYDAILADADLTGANLQDADFRNANLYGAKLAGANIYDAKLQGADLTGVTYDARTIWPRGFTPPGRISIASRDSQGGRMDSRGSRYAAGKIVAPKDITHDVLKEVTDVIEQYVRSSSQIEDLVTQSILRLKAKYERKYDGFRLRDPQAIAQDFLYLIQLNPSMNYDTAREVLGNYTHVISSPSDRMASLGNSTAVPAIGDILVSSWGYDQTNVDFYEVVGISGSMITIQEIGKRIVGQESGSEKVMPVPGRYTGKPMRKKPSPSYSGKYGVKISTYASASLWNGMPQYQTAAGYGH